MTTVDPAVQILLEEAPFDLPAADQTPDELRARMRTAIRSYEGPRFAPDRVDRIEDLVIRGEHGEIPVRVYSSAAPTPTAVVVYFHGGGWVAGSIDTHDKITRRLCVATGAVVVSVDYRLAPEHPFPAGLQDSYDSLLWASVTYPGVPILVAGDSAGGTLAACVALRARDEDGPALSGQLLIYPAVDDDLDTETMREFAERYALTRDDCATYFGWYLTREGDHADPYAMPGFATSLAGLPPTVVATAGFDPLRASEESYSERLRDAAVQVVLQSHPTLIHGWIDFYPRVPAARRAVDELVDAALHLINQAAAAPAFTTPASTPATA